MIGIGFDVLLALALVWSALRALTVSDLFRAVVLFIVFGLLMTLAWARLDAPDIALAEAAIGAGLTGALLLDTVGHLRARQGHAAHAPQPPVSRVARAAALALSIALAAALLASIATLPPPAIRLAASVEENISASGVSHPVTAVLLNFRGYDTLLEVAVLLLALLGVLALRADAARFAPPSAPPLLTDTARAVTPVMVLVAAYLLWAGAHRPGGAFQAGAVLAAAAVLMHLAGLLQPAPRPRYRLALRAGMLAGLALFIAAALPLGGAMLQYPLAWAKVWIFTIESALTVSIGMMLAAMYLDLPNEKEGAEE